MTNAQKKPGKAELVALLQTKGWDVVTGSPTTPTSSRTLEQAARDAHARHKKGETPGALKQQWITNFSSISSSCNSYGSISACRCNGGVQVRRR